MKKQNKTKTLIKIANALRKQYHAMRDYYSAKGDKITAEEYLVRACEWSFVIDLLEDDNFFKTTTKNLHIEDAE